MFVNDKKIFPQSKGMLSHSETNGIKKIRENASPYWSLVPKL